MLIDWFTVAAQVLNFLVLVWLMKRYLYTPILAAVDARETRISKELSDAAANKADAQREHDNFQEKIKAFDRQKSGLLKEATDAADAQRQHLIDDAGREADAVAAKRREALETETKDLKEAIRLRTEEQVIAIARRALADLASASLEDRIVGLFIGRLATMDERTRAGLAEAARSSASSTPCSASTPNG